MKNPVERCTLANWTAPVPVDEAARLQHVIEAGGVLWFPDLPFVVDAAEHRFLSAECASGKAKNISLDPATGGIKGSSLEGDDRAALGAMIGRFAAHARGLVERLFPDYRPYLDQARTSYRPVEIEGRASSYRKDDTRLHVDAFASRPNRGRRILRVFTNVNAEGRPRVWNVGEPFAEFARRFVPRVPAQLPGSARLLHAIGVTRELRTPYDHFMLNLHDLGKADLEYQRGAGRVRAEFPPGSTWVCFTDSVLHAVLSGRCMLEQTILVPVDAMTRPELSPLRVLERMLDRPLV